MFNSKEEYLQYRTDWKRRYAALSQDIRDLKLCRKSTESIKALGQVERYERTQKKFKNQFGFFPQSLCVYYRAKATEMLLERKESKAESQRQYLAKKAEMTVNQ